VAYIDLVFHTSSSQPANRPHHSSQIEKKGVIFIGHIYLAFLYNAFSSIPIFSRLWNITAVLFQWH
jgi:hypothetical protein